MPNIHRYLHVDDCPFVRRQRDACALFQHNWQPQEAFFYLPKESKVLWFPTFRGDNAVYVNLLSADRKTITFAMQDGSCIESDPDNAEEKARRIIFGRFNHPNDRYCYRYLGEFDRVMANEYEWQFKRVKKMTKLSPCDCDQ